MIDKMEIIIAPIVLIVVFILCYTLPETETEAQTVENRRLRKQRQRGNFDATPRTAPRKTELLTFKSAYKEYTYDQRRKIAEDIFDVIHNQSKMKLTEAHILWKKDVIEEIKGIIAGLDSSDDYYQEFYGDMLTEGEAELVTLEKHINKSL
jgi:hypothetical protein